MCTRSSSIENNISDEKLGLIVTERIVLYCNVRGRSLPLMVEDTRTPKASALQLLQHRPNFPIKTSHCLRNRTSYSSLWW